MIDAARKLIGTFQQLDPGPECWQFIQTHRIDLWQAHCLAIRESDLTKAATTYKAMLEAWQQRGNLKQDSFFD